MWLKFLTEIGEKTRAAPQELLDNPEVAQALEIMEVAAYSDAELAAYDGYWDAVRIEATIIGDLERTKKAAKAAKVQIDALTAERDAAIGKMRQSARQMKTDGMDVETIVKYTGLTAEEVNAL